MCFDSDLNSTAVFHLLLARVLLTSQFGAMLAELSGIIADTKTSLSSVLILLSGARKSPKFSGKF